MHWEVADAQAPRSGFAIMTAIAPVNPTLVWQEMPTTGGARPGPVGLAPPTVSAAASKGAGAVAIRIPSIQVDSAVEPQPVVDGVMQNPSSPWIVAWYPATSRLGVPGNAVLSGHVDWFNVPQAVFFRLGDLQPGAGIELTGSDGLVYRYAVAWSKLYDAANAPLAEIIGATADERITLITCGGTFDAANQVYLQRRVVRGVRAG